MKSGRGIASPFVEIEVAGMECDNQKFKTGTRGGYCLNSQVLDSVIPCIVHRLCDVVYTHITLLLFLVFLGGIFTNITCIHV